MRQTPGTLILTTTPPPCRAVSLAWEAWTGGTRISSTLCPATSTASAIAAPDPPCPHEQNSKSSILGSVQRVQQIFGINPFVTSLYMSMHGFEPGDHRSGHTQSCVERLFRYLIWIESGTGVGSRLLSLLSAFLYALLTDRILLVHTGGGMARWVSSAPHTHTQTHTQIRTGGDTTLPIQLAVRPLPPIHLVAPPRLLPPPPHSGAPPERVCGGEDQQLDPPSETPLPPH